MGLYDREYYRDEPAGYRNWVAGRVTVWLVAVLASIFILQILSKPDPFKADNLLLAGRFQIGPILDGQFWRFFTAPFLHDSTSFLPIVFSLLVLYFFGRGVEDDLGGPELLCFYLAAIPFTQIVEFVARLTNIEISTGYSYGSAGPVTAVLVLYACRHPYETVRLMFVLPVPLWSVAVGIVVINVFGMMGSGREPALPLAGAAFGFFYHKSQIRLSAYLVSTRGRRRPARRPQLRVVPQEEDAPEPVVAAPLRREARIDEQLEAKLDIVLEKVARQGRGSLSSDENDLLLRASEVYRNRKSP